MLGTDNLSVPGVYDEMKAWLDKGQRGGDWPVPGSRHVLAASLWLVGAGVILTVAVSDLAGLIVLGVAVAMVLVAGFERYVMPRAVPQLELLSSPDQPTHAATWAKNARVVGIFIGGLLLGAIINELVGRLL